MRYLDLGTVSAARSQAIYHAVASLMAPGDGITLVTVSPDKPYVCVGFHQVTSREVDVEFCRRNQVPISRRMTGGGAVYLDENQIFWHLIFPQRFADVDRLYEKFLAAPVRVYQRMGIEAVHRPVNDIVVGPRKIGGTGAATIGDATVLVGSLMMDFNVEAMAKVLQVPSEKFRDKLIFTLQEYMTSVKRELGEQVPFDRELATRWLVEAFENVIGETAVPGSLTEREERALAEFESTLFSEDFVFTSEGILQRGVKISGDVRLYEGVYKAPGGLIRLIYREREGKFDDVLLAGDFFAEPQDRLLQFAKRLRGATVTTANIESAAQWLLEAAHIPGVSVADLVRAFLAANPPIETELRSEVQ
ncbi:lipoate--protein ligase family protein [Alicyclobacillus tolerans]|uniref:lipoate--protein ligase family protein n=1 Tax=Alicyclobacillus tolerans TaxID=90970 RepID=UPI001F2017C4|nr:biotin/lipoate A/B protein ligase family protein [Alicyclobacillus tolerans]MCF8563631.1 lipoate--protein ligase family protein [Alicyclobacillus tolerans]